MKILRPTSAIKPDKGANSREPSKGGRHTEGGSRDDEKRVRG